MKTNILYKLGIAALLAALLVLTGCKDSFLEVEPGKKMTLTEYFSTDEHIYEAVAATYHPCAFSTGTVPPITPSTFAAR